MAVVTIDSGEVPSAYGLTDGNLDRCVQKWQRIALSNFCSNAKPLLNIIEQVDELRLWETYWDGMYKTREEFLRRKVLVDFDVVEHDLPLIIEKLRRGEDVKLTPRAAVERAPVLADWGNEEGEGNSRNRVGVAKSVSSGGTTTSYLAARLKRDHPDIVERIGEFPSIRAAAIAAGIVKPTWQAPVDFDDLMAAVERRYPGLMHAYQAIKGASIPSC
jgi:hypothetical protein